MLLFFLVLECAFAEIEEVGIDLPFCAWHMATSTTPYTSHPAGSESRRLRQVTPHHAGRRQRR